MRNLFRDEIKITKENQFHLVRVYRTQCSTRENVDIARDALLGIDRSQKFASVTGQQKRKNKDQQKTKKLAEKHVRK